MHIPDGLLSAPVWGALDVVAVPAIGFASRRAGAGMTDSRAPLLGVLGAFVFAAQMVNFPIAAGISSHLVGSALLTFTVGPAAASVVMTAILVIQALLFQDGGVLALGANVFNLAFVSVIAAYLPVYLFARVHRTLTMFIGAALSVFAAGSLTVLQILLSGIAIPQPLVSAAIAFFLISAVVEGVITVLVLRSIEALNPNWVRTSPLPTRRVQVLFAVGAILLGTLGFWLASTQPDVLDNLTSQIGVHGTEGQSPFSNYEFPAIRSELIAKVVISSIGLLSVFLACMAASKLLRRSKST